MVCGMTTRSKFLAPLILIILVTIVCLPFAAMGSVGAAMVLVCLYALIPSFMVGWYVLLAFKLWEQWKSNQF